ncbi:MAG: hypothetical protein HYX68_26985 [Planctomycetes bacterium]|nr:hypothetical protein [Planctomycetota bacterium]
MGIRHRFISSYTSVLETNQGMRSFRFIQKRHDSGTTRIRFYFMGLEKWDRRKLNTAGARNELRTPRSVGLANKDFARNWRTN